MASRSVFAVCVLFAANCLAADFDGDGVADELKVTREAEKFSEDSGVRLVNPWHAEKSSGKSSSRGLALLVRLTRQPQTFLLYDTDFFKTPSWQEGKPPVRVVTKKDKGYAAWKKQVPGLRADAIELGTEAGIDILLYWDGRWRLFWPKEEP